MRLRLTPDREVPIQRGVALAPISVFVNCITFKKAYCLVSHIVNEGRDFTACCKCRAYRYVLVRASLLICKHDKPIFWYL